MQNLWHARGLQACLLSHQGSSRAAPALNSALGAQLQLPIISGAHSSPSLLSGAFKVGPAVEVQTLSRSASARHGPPRRCLERQQPADKGRHDHSLLWRPAAAGPAACTGGRRQHRLPPPGLRTRLHGVYPRQCLRAAHHAHCRQHSCTWCLPRAPPSRAGGGRGGRGRRRRHLHVSWSRACAVCSALYLPSLLNVRPPRNPNVATLQVQGRVSDRPNARLGGAAARSAASGGNGTHRRGAGGRGRPPASLHLPRGDAAAGQPGATARLRRQRLSTHLACRAARPNGGAPRLPDHSGCGAAAHCRVVRRSRAPVSWQQPAGSSAQRQQPQPGEPPGQPGHRRRWRCCLLPGPTCSARRWARCAPRQCRRPRRLTGPGAQGGCFPVLA